MDLGSIGENLVLSVQNLSIDLDGMRVLDGVSLSVRRGEFIGLIGPNGAGKSTLLRSIIGIYSASSGRVLVAGESAHEMRAQQLARLVSLMPQNLVLSFPFSCREVVQMGRHPYIHRFQGETSEDKRAVTEAMEVTDTLRLEERTVTSLSGGEQQLVSMAKTLAQTCPVILLDEPTANLDLRYQQMIFAFIREYVGRGGTAIAAIHDLGLAATYCHRLILLSEGVVEADGPPERVLESSVLSQVYQIGTRVYSDIATGKPRVMPDRATFRREQPVLRSRYGERVHVVSGGGSGLRLIRLLWSHGFRLTCGVLHEGDVDLEVCRVLGVESVHSRAFTVIDPQKAKENDRLIAEADTVFVTPFCVSASNRENLISLSKASCLLLIGDSAEGVLESFHTADDGDRNLVAELLERGSTEIISLSSLESRLGGYISE